jgi:hypothetical protein
VVVEVFGLLAVSAMVVTYALEGRSPIYVLGFAASCLAASLYAWLIHSWPFAGVEGVWALVAVRRWMRLRRRARP